MAGASASMPFCARLYAALPRPPVISGQTPGFGKGVVNDERLTAECEAGTSLGAGGFGTEAVTVIAVTVAAVAPSNAARFA